MVAISAFPLQTPKGTNGYCSIVPSGRSTSISEALGGLGAVSNGFDEVVNYNSGQTSLFCDWWHVFWGERGS